jgi:hypothetical protein
VNAVVAWHPRATLVGYSTHVMPYRVQTLIFSARITSRSCLLTAAAIRVLILQPVSKFRAATYVKRGTQSCNLKLNFRTY